MSAADPTETLAAVEAEAPRPPRSWSGVVPIGLGILLLVLGLAVRARLFPGLPPAATAGAVGLGGLLLAWAWPRAEPLQGGLWGLIVVAAVGLALLGRPAPALELTAGVLAAAGLWARAWAARRDQEVALPAKVRVQRGGKPRSVPRHEVVTGDRCEVDDGELIPVDGQVEGGQGFVDERVISGSGLPVAKQPGDRVYAGTRSAMAELVVVAERPAAESLVLLKRRAAKLLEDTLVEERRERRLLGLPAGVLALAFVGWALTQSAPWASRLELAAAALLLASPLTATMASLLTRLELGRQAYARGLVVTRVKDLLTFGRIRRWQVEPQLLIGGGQVEVVELSDIPSATLLVVAQALLADGDGPEARVLTRVVEKRKLERLPAAALKDKGGVRHGTINGRRWMIGLASALEAEEKLVLAPQLKGTIAFLGERSLVVLYLALAEEGLVGALGLDLELDPDLARAARGVEATLLGGLPDHLRAAIAEKAGLVVNGPPPKARDAALLSEHGPPPSAGLRLRVVELSAEPLLKLEAAPRIFRPAAAQLSELLAEGAVIRRRGLRRLLVATVGAPLALGLLLVGGGPTATSAVVVGLVTVFALLL